MNNDDLLRRQRAPGMSALAQRLPGQRTPPDPSLEQPNAADLTYGWHHESSSDEDDGVDVPERRRILLNEEDEDDNDVFTDVEEEDEEEEERQHQLRQLREQFNGERNHDVDDDDDDDDAIHNNNVLQNNEANFQSPFSRGIFYLASVWNRWRYDGTGMEEDTNNANDPYANQAQQEDDQRDSFVCRICFDGPGSVGEGGESLGKLIAPCKCRGTMKFVHQGCLTRWRATSRRQTSIMQCDQCGAPYRFKKSKFVGLATNKALLIALSCYMFISLVWIVGYAAEATMAYMDESAVQSRKLANANKKQSHSSYLPSWLSWGADSENIQSSSNLGNKLYSAINLDRTEEPGYYDYDDFYGYRYDYRYAYSEPVAYYTLIKAAVKYVGSGRAFGHLFPSYSDGTPLSAGQDAIAIEQQIQDEENGWWSTLIDDWKYGVGGIWEGKRPRAKEADKKAEKMNDQGSSDFSLPSPTISASSEQKESTGEQRKENEEVPKSQRERYDAITAKVLKTDEKVVRPITRKRVQKGGKVRKIPGFESNQGKPSILERIILQLSLGASLVGMSSFLTLLLGISTWAPFHLNLGLGRGFARVARRRARGSGNGGGGGSEGEALVAVFLLFLVIVGIIRALFAVYKLTNYFSKRLLTRVEDIILDWGSEEDEGDGQRMNNAQHEEQEHQPFNANQHVHAAQEHARRRWHERFNAPAWTLRFRRRNQNNAEH